MQLIVCKCGNSNLVSVSSTIFDSFPAEISAFGGPRVNLDWVDIYPEHLAKNIFREFTCCLVSLPQHQSGKYAGGALAILKILSPIGLTKIQQIICFPRW